MNKNRSIYLLVLLAGLMIVGGILLLSSQYLSKPTELSSRAATSYYIPPASERSTIPSGATLLNGGVGITNQAAMSSGNFQVEGYCPRKGLGNVTRNDNDWFCGSTKLTATNFDEICQLTYASHPNSFALSVNSSAVPALRWRCYESIITTATTTTTPTTTTTTTSTYNISDLNYNGKSDPDDYRLFLEDYLKHL